MSTLSALIENVSSGVCQILLMKNVDLVATGTGFLIDQGIVTNFHIFEKIDFDTLVIRFPASRASQLSNSFSEQELRLPCRELNCHFQHESPTQDKDYVVIGIEEKLLGRHRFSFASDDGISAGDQILFLGYPFRMNRLTAHVGYVSSIFENNKVCVYQIDGSVNGGNSGGPMLTISSGKVAGIVTRALKGTIDEDFENLILCLGDNIRLLEQVVQCGISLSVGGFDAVEGVKSCQAAIKNIAENLYMSANVGIGYAFSSKYLRNKLYGE